MNANMIFKWLRDPRYTPEAGSGAPAIAPDVARFLPVEIIDRPKHDEAPRATDPVPAAGTIEIDVAGGHRLRISGAYDPDALAWLIRGLSA
jgi:transposase